MTRIQIPNPARNDPQAVAAVDKINHEVGAVQTEAALIETDAEEILRDAMTSEPTEAVELAKRVEVLRVRRLAIILRELRVPGQKTEAQTIIRQACRAEGERLAAGLVEHETILSGVANELGMGTPSRERHALFVGNPERRGLLAAKTEADLASNNWAATCAADTARVLELKAQLASILR